jgi:hypothetical protein
LFGALDHGLAIRIEAVMREIDTDIDEIWSRVQCVPYAKVRKTTILTCIR